jgi:hypothetical protein
MKFIVDRIEENMVVCEVNEKTINVPIDFFPFLLEEGKTYNMQLEKLPENKDTKKRFESLFE